MKKNARVTQALIREVSNRVANNAVKKRIEVRRKREHDFAVKIINSLVTEEQWEKMRELPERFFPLTDHIFASFDGHYTRVLLQEQMRVPVFLTYGAVLSTEGDHPLSKENRKIRLDEHKIEEDRRDVRNTTAAFMRNFRTVKALVEAWPEIQGYLPKLEEAPKNLPAVQVDHVKEKIACAKKGNCAGGKHGG